MPIPGTIEATVIHDLPATLEREIGRVIVKTAKLENDLLALVALLLQLQKPEARLVVRDQRLHERLDTIQDLFALKAIFPEFKFETFRKLLEEVANERDRLAHGVWLKHPDTKVIYLRLTRGNWGRKSHEPKVQRKIYPEATEFTAAHCRLLRDKIEKAIVMAAELGQHFDTALKTLPDRFRPLAPVINPLGYRTPKKLPTPQKPSRE